MKSIKKIIPTFAFLIFTCVVISAQTPDAAADVATNQPSWIENPIGSIVGLILLIGLFAGMAKAALAKE